MDVPSIDNRFVKPYGVPEIINQILRLKNIEVAPELVMLDVPFTSPGLHSVPLAILDEKDEQLYVMVQLTPKDVSEPGGES